MAYTKYGYSKTPAIMAAAISLVLMLLVLGGYFVKYKIAGGTPVKEPPARDPYAYMLMEAEEESDQVFCTPYQKSQILTITFLDTLENVPAEVWDVSYLENSNVLAWAEPNEEKYDLYIAAEGGVVAPENCGFLFSGYGSLTDIAFGDCFDTSMVTDMQNMFSCSPLLKKLDLSGFDTSGVTNMSEMFYALQFLEVLDISSFDTSDVTNMSGMFHTCQMLTVLDLSHFDTGNVTDMGGMFALCVNLTELNISSFDTAMVTDMGSMFASTSLTELDLSHFDTRNVTDMSNMFAYTYALEKVNVSSFDTSMVTDMSGMFTGTHLSALDLRNFNTANVTNMQNMFSYSQFLTELDLSSFDTSNVLFMDGIFDECPAGAQWHHLLHNTAADGGIVADIYFDHSITAEGEVAVITGLNLHGDPVWEHTTQTYPGGYQIDQIAEIGRAGDRYYYYEGSVVFALDANTGSVLWHNIDFGGEGGCSYIDADGTIYMSGFWEPSLFVVNADGQTIHRIREFDKDYSWAKEVTKIGDKIAVTMDLGPEPYADDYVFLVDPTDFSYELQ